MREAPSLSQLNDCLSLLGESRLLGQLPASASKVEDNCPLCALVITSCQMVADGVFLVFHGQSAPLHSTFPLPPPLRQTEHRLLNPVIFSIIPFNGKELLKGRFFFIWVWSLNYIIKPRGVVSAAVLTFNYHIKHEGRAPGPEEEVISWGPFFSIHTREMVL